MSSGLARHVLDAIRTAGVRTICVCPGARNAEWVQFCAQEDSGFEVFWFFEERSASFFALGRIKAIGQPVAVATTSGTAAGELLPAVMEGFYSGLPLFVLTADRPRRFRGSGAPQSAEQVGIFGVYAPTAFDLAGDERLPGQIEARSKPVHLNVCFDDPNSTGGEQETGQPGPDCPFVIVGALAPKDRQRAEELLLSMGMPVYLESLSGLRDSVKLEPLKIRVADGLLARAKGCGYPINVVVRLGGVPTHRFWRDLEDWPESIDVVSMSETGFSGLGRLSAHLQADISGLLEVPIPLTGAVNAEPLFAEDRRAFEVLRQAILAEPASEPAMFEQLSQHIPAGARVFLGNSLPIREWDLAASWSSRGFEISASRGLNGIDGQISTFLGMCEPGRPAWAILGDLTALYDLAAPWALGQLGDELDATLVIVNNGGGKIFERMFQAPEFQNRHHLSFEHWAEMWGMSYERAESPAGLEACLEKSNRGLRVIELCPDPEATARFWAAYRSGLG
jgi:2-succinyl-5-enolpyruvyl-6-hydroxy-3-cyclohexene-1-carboxylate synthase